MYVQKNGKFNKKQKTGDQKAKKEDLKKEEDLPE
eukprot:SAG31_NODE_37498_length_303_cov_3.524510_2_plen_33_part_01